MKKLLAPTIITAILVILTILWVMAYFLVGIPWPIVLILLIIAIAVIGVMIFVLVERVKEIRSGEEDDLSKY